VDTLEFLRLVWPAAGTYLLAIPRAFTKDGEVIPYHQHIAHTSIEAAAADAVRLSSDPAARNTVFFALATVQNDYTGLTKSQRDEQGVKVRGGANTHEAKAFWLDLDVGPDAGKYTTPLQAVDALRQFCRALAMPRPFVTSSGGGFHVYWPLTEPLTADRWLPAAATLKALTQAWGLKADPSRTSDMASVLRPAGTFNWKTGTPRPVEVVLEGKAVSPDAFIAHLARLREQYGVTPVEQRRVESSLLGAVPAFMRPTGDVNAQAAEGAGYAAPKASAVVKACPSLLWQMGNQAAVPEPLWYAMIGCLRHADKGTRAIHMMSNQHPQYSEARTDDKIVQHENSGVGPTLCETFALHTPEQCGACPHRGHIKTPLSVVRVMEEAPAPKVEVPVLGGDAGATMMLELPPPPKPFKRVVAPGADAGKIAISVEDKDGRVYDEVIYEFDLYPVKLVKDERTGEFCVMIRTWLPHEGWNEHNIPTGKFYDRRSLAQTLGSLGVMADIARVEELVQYMVAYIKELQKQCKAGVVYAQLGWREDTNLFVLPHMTVSPQGIAPVETSVNINNALQWQEPKGDLAAWKAIVGVYERPGMEALQFGFGVGLAAPLFGFTNFNGAIVNMVGKRGSGKSSAALCANSIYGHKKMGWLDLEQDTWKSFYGKLGALNNLPATYDEITNIDGELLSNLAYAVTKGQGRQRLQQNGQAAESWGNWQTMMLTTSNASLHSKLATAKADASAEASRIFEFTVPSGTMRKEDADENFDRLNDHYGVAGPVYAQALVNNREWARERVKHWVKVVDKAAGSDSTERFWSAVVASVLTGFEVANGCGLTNANVDRLLAFGVAQIRAMRGVVTESVRTAESLVADYINSNLRSMLAVNSDAEGKTLAQITISPSSDRLRLRLERHKGKLYIDRADFRRFCKDCNADARQVQNELVANGVLRADATKYVLGKGTVFSGAQTMCWVLDFNSPVLSGAARAVDAAEQESAA
jgi:energy-coupling factor transporter ATP-binding protein EcfA2